MPNQPSQGTRVHPPLEMGLSRPCPHGLGKHAQRKPDELLEGADRRLVLGPSTSAEVAYIFAGPEHSSGSKFAMLRHLPIDLLKVGLDPAHA